MIKPTTFESAVLANVPITPTVNHLVLTIHDVFIFEPGQFVSIITTVDGKEHRRPYSIASAPNKEDHLSICIKNVEDGLISPSLCKLEVGAELKILGPLGQFTLTDIEESVFIATGAGVAPFRGMIPTLLMRTKRPVMLFAGVRKQEEVLYDGEFKELAEKYPNFTYHTILSRPDEPEKKQKEKTPTHTGRVQALVEKYVTNYESQFYICGLWPMIEETKALLLTKGTPKENIEFERYS
jgi:ferredoxin-NADP reductase